MSLRDRIGADAYDKRYGKLHRDFAVMVREEPPPKDWLVRHMLVRGRHMLLCGAAGAGKTQTALQLAYQAVQDRPDEFVHGLMDVPKQLRVAIVDSEMGPDQYHERVWDMGLNGLLQNDRLDYIDASTLDINNENDNDYLLEQLDGADLVIMDSLKALSPGAIENDNDVMAAYTRTITNMARHLDAGIITIHHWGKEDRYRGASAILDQCDAMFGFQQNDPNNDDGYRKLTGRGRHLKVRYAKTPPDLWFQQLDTGLLVPAPDGPPAEPASKWDDVIRGALPFTGTKKAFAEACGTNSQNNAWADAYARVATTNGSRSHHILIPPPECVTPEI